MAKGLTDLTSYLKLFLLYYFKIDTKTHVANKNHGFSFTYLAKCACKNAVNFVKTF